MDFLSIASQPRPSYHRKKKIIPHTKWATPSDFYAFASLASLTIIRDFKTKIWSFNSHINLIFDSNAENKIIIVVL